ncbi:CocE/NonD family hydrolase, partial [Staphylococcus aureus]|uniref:CocE/NonD family hydrolase n=1 Tax=Staphylococcus aureus TaxID=1280 RepID=UPI00214C72BB
MIQIKGAVKFPITLDSTTWIFDDRKVSIEDLEKGEWAANQSWSNGNIGTNGVSYLAVTQWWVASLNPPHLKAMIPWEGLNDMYREVAFHGGIPDT